MEMGTRGRMEENETYGKQSGNAESLELFVFGCLQGTGDGKLFLFYGQSEFFFLSRQNNKTQERRKQK